MIGSQIPIPVSAPAPVSSAPTAWAPDPESAPEAAEPLLPLALPAVADVPEPSPFPALAEPPCPALLPAPPPRTLGAVAAARLAAPCPAGPSEFRVRVTDGLTADESPPPPPF